MAVRAATVIARGDAAHGVRQCVSLCCLYTAFCTVVCVACRTYSVWDYGRDFVVVGTLSILYCYHPYPLLRTIALFHTLRSLTLARVRA